MRTKRGTPWNLIGCRRFCRRGYVEQVTGVSHALDWMLKRLQGAWRHCGNQEADLLSEELQGVVVLSLSLRLSEGTTLLWAPQTDTVLFFEPASPAPLGSLAVSSAWCSVLRLCARGSDGDPLTGALMEGQGQISRCKIVVVGDTQCGKTALLHVFAKDSYPEVRNLGFCFRTNWSEENKFL